MEQLPMMIGNRKVEVEKTPDEFLSVKIPEPQVKKLCEFIGIQYVEKFVRDEDGNILYTTTSDNKRRPQTNNRERMSMAKGIRQFLVVLCDQLDNAKEDENGTKTLAISYEP